MKKLFILLLFLGTTLAYGQRQRLIEITQDTLTRPRSSQIVGIAGLNSTFYLIPSVGNAIRMAQFTELQSLSSQLSTKENSFTKNSAFNKSFGTSSGTVLEGNYSPGWNSITGKPVTFPFVSDFTSKWDSLRLAGFQVDNMSVINDFIVNGSAEITQGNINSLYIEELELDVGITGANGKAVMYRSGMAWDSVKTSDIVGITNYIRSDTSNGRAVFQIPDYVAGFIPDSSHIVLEPDYVKAYQINSAFGTVPLGYEVVSVGLDSTELTLQKPNYNITYQIFCTCFDAPIIGYYDTIPYKVGIQDSPDSITLFKAESILYFNDTIWYDAGNMYRFSNYISNTHPIPQFRNKTRYLGAQVAWDNKQQKFFIK